MKSCLKSVSIARKTIYIGSAAGCPDYSLEHIAVDLLEYKHVRISCAVLFLTAEELPPPARFPLQYVYDFYNMRYIHYPFSLSDIPLETPRLDSLLRVLKKEMAAGTLMLQCDETLARSTYVAACLEKACRSAGLG